MLVSLLFSMCPGFVQGYYVDCFLLFPSVVDGREPLHCTVWLPWATIMLFSRCIPFSAEIGIRTWNGLGGMTSAVPFSNKVELRLFRFECASRHIIPAPFQVTSTAASDTAGVACLATRMGEAIPSGIRCSMLGFSHAFFIDTASTLLAYSLSFMTETDAIDFNCTGAICGIIVEIYRTRLSLNDVPRNYPRQACRSRQTKRVQYWQASSRTRGLRYSSPALSRKQSFVEVFILSSSQLYASCHSVRERFVRMKIGPAAALIIDMTTMMADFFRPTLQRTL